MSSSLEIFAYVTVREKEAEKGVPQPKSLPYGYSINNVLCGLGKVTSALWASVFSLVKGLKERNLQRLTWISPTEILADPDEDCF